MQKFIDIVIQWVKDQAYATEAWVLAKDYLTTSYVDRGDPFAADYLAGDFIKDNTWYDLDLSAIVPPGAKAVLLRVLLFSGQVNSIISLRQNGNINLINIASTRTTVANIVQDCPLIVALDSNAVIEYRFSVDTWIFISITISGWWL